MRPLSPFPRRARDERGYTMVFAMIVLLVSSLLVAGAFAAAEGDIGLTHTDTAQKDAYAAALAGVETFKYHMTTNTNYWQECLEPKGKVPGTEGNIEESFSVKTLPANGNAKCIAEKQPTIIETSGTASGTFRIESTGTYKNGARTVTRKIVATFTHPGFLNYVFLSNFEVEDPATFEPEPTKCAQYYNERKAAGALAECPGIPFIPADKQKGPFHTNDAVEICANGGEKPVFGRNKNDSIEMGQGHYQDTEIFFCKNEPELLGKYTEVAGTLLPPKTDTELLETAEYKYKGRTVIELENGGPNTMTVTSWNFVTKKPVVEAKKAWPANGVIYVSNEGSCKNKYSPFGADKNYATDVTEPNCGNVYIKGKYTQSLTVASQNDVIIIGNLETTPYSAAAPEGAATLGLIAEDFVRIYHPIGCEGGTCTIARQETCTNGVPQTAGGAGVAKDPLGWGVINEPVVDAAILATNHSFIVDNFPCASKLNNLTVWGAIAQYWRGRVAANLNGEPYIKNYNYDERLAVKQPPNFLSPTSTNWHISRETSP
jgi:hypothetical protein